MRMRALESIFPSRRGAKTCLFWIGMGNADNTGSGIGNHLVGTIPPEIGDFAELTRLVLHTNVISGQIPTELGKLTKLEELLAVPGTANSRRDCQSEAAPNFEHRSKRSLFPSTQSSIPAVHRPKCRLHNGPPARQNRH
jgi:hypothetical protein